MSQSPELDSLHEAGHSPPVSEGSTDSADAGNGLGPENDGGGSFTSRQLGWMLLFTLLAAALRLTSIGEWSLWIDEAHTFRDVITPTDEFWNSGTSKYPLSFLLLRGFAGMFGMVPADLSEEVMRLPFAFFGIASVPAVAIVARGMVGSSAALLAALFLALSPWHIYWSQNARSYSMVLFFCLVATGAAFHGFHRRSWPLLLAAVVFFFLGGFSHPSGYVLLSSALVYFLLVTFLPSGKRPRFAKWGALGILLLLIVVVFLLQPVVERMLEVKGSQFSLFHLAQTMLFYVGVPVLMAAVGGMLHLFDRQAPAATFLGVMFVLPLLALSILSMVGVQTVSAQYALAALPTIYILAATLIMAFARAFKGTGTRTLVLRMVPLAMIVVHMLGQDYLYFMKQYGWRPRWEEAVRYIETHAPETGKDDTRILTTNGPSIRYYVDSSNFFAKRQRGETISVRAISIYSWMKRSPESFLEEEIENADRNRESLWAVVTEPELEEMDRDGRGNVFFRKRFRQVRRLPNWTGPKDMCVLVYYYDPKSR